MEPATILLLAFLFFLAAILYSSVGHAGASAYLAAMILTGVPAAIMRPTAFTLNIFVASLVLWQFHRHGFFDWKLLWPFVLASVPAAFTASFASAPAWTSSALVVVLVLGAVRLLLVKSDQQPIFPMRFSSPMAFVVGGMIGAISGMTGTGGGIFLSPVLLFFGWADARKTAATSAAFILMNSLAGLAGSYTSAKNLPPAILLWVPVVAVGAWIGTHMSIRRFNPLLLVRLLAIIMLVAVIKLLWG